MVMWSSLACVLLWLRTIELNMVYNRMYIVCIMLKQYFMSYFLLSITTFILYRQFVAVSHIRDPLQQVFFFAVMGCLFGDLSIPPMQHRFRQYRICQHRQSKNNLSVPTPTNVCLNPLLSTCFLLNFIGKYIYI